MKSEVFSFQWRIVDLNSSVNQSEKNIEINKSKNAIEWRLFFVQWKKCQKTFWLKQKMKKCLFSVLYSIYSRNWEINARSYQGFDILLFPRLFSKVFVVIRWEFFYHFFGKLGEIVGMTMLKLFYHNFLKNQLEKQYTQIISRQTELFNKIYVSNFLVEIENGSSKYD